MPAPRKCSQALNTCTCARLGSSYTKIGLTRLIQHLDKYFDFLLIGENKSGKACVQGSIFLVKENSIPSNQEVIWCQERKGAPQSKWLRLRVRWEPPAGPTPEQFERLGICTGLGSHLDPPLCLKGWVLKASEPNSPQIIQLSVAATSGWF